MELQLNICSFSISLRSKVCFKLIHNVELEGGKEEHNAMFYNNKRAMDLFAVFKEENIKHMHPFSSIVCATVKSF